jgi:hypothetical protein
MNLLILIRKFEEKNLFFVFNTMVLNPLKIQEKKKKKTFFGRLSKY